MTQDDNSIVDQIRTVYIKKVSIGAKTGSLVDGSTGVPCSCHKQDRHCNTTCVLFRTKKHRITGEIKGEYVTEKRFHVYCKDTMIGLLVNYDEPLQIIETSGPRKNNAETRVSSGID